MNFQEYLKELAIKKGTTISSPRYKKESMYEQDIVLEDGLKFKFIGYYFKTESIWEIAFEDEEERRETVRKRKGASLELFAALEKVFKQFVEKALPDKFRFSAALDEKSRVKLYDLLAKKIEKMGMGFKLKKTKSSVSAIYWFSHWSVK